MKTPKLLVLSAVAATALTGCASMTLTGMATDATSRDLRVQRDQIEVHDARVARVDLRGTVVEWRAVVGGVMFDCSGYEVEQSTCLESPDQTLPIPVAETESE